MPTLSKVSLFKTDADGSGQVSFSFSVEVMERLEGALAPYKGTPLTKQTIREIEHKLECELRKILWENDYDTTRGW